MKVSAFTPPDPDETPRHRGIEEIWALGVSAPRWSVAVGIAALYIAAHLPFLPPSLEDIDSINFALGLRDFDPAQHQPHPPGYPVFIALGRGVLALVSGTWSAASPVAAEALALSLISAISAGIAL